MISALRWAAPRLGPSRLRPALLAAGNERAELGKRGRWWLCV